MKAAQEHFLEHFGLEEWTEEDKVKFDYSYLQMIKFAESFANTELSKLNPTIF